MKSISPAILVTPFKTNLRDSLVFSQSFLTAGARGHHWLKRDECAAKDSTFPAERPATRDRDSPPREALPEPNLSRRSLTKVRSFAGSLLFQMAELIGIGPRQGPTARPPEGRAGKVAAGWRTGRDPPSPAKAGLKGFRVVGGDLV